MSILFKKTQIFTSVFLTVFFLFDYLGKPTLAQSCTDISDLNQRIKCLEEQVGKLKDQGRTLSSQIAQFDAQIRLTTLKISQTEEKISLLGGRIDQLEESLTNLDTAFSSRARETYKMSRFEDNFSFVLGASDVNNAVSRFHYLKKIQEADRDLFNRLQNAQTVYIGEKVDQEELQKQLQKEKANLNSQKLAKAQLLTATKNDEVKYQSLLAEAKAQLAAFSRFVVGQGGASILSNQTKCNSWGCYYNQRDSQWGNMSLGGSPYSVAAYGCLVSSVSMIASHYGRNIKPNDIAANPSAFVPNTGFLYWSFSVNGINVSISKASTSVMDSELSAGRPVIAGLYSGPDHFIVILRKEGDKYIMHDPFMENGSERPLTDKYSVSNITSLRLVSFN